jgi:hypothetical protein
MTQRVRALPWLPALRLAGLVALTAISWCVMLNRVSLPAWQTPLNYQGDSLIVLSRIKAAVLLQPASQPERPTAWIDFSEGWHEPESDA